MALITFADKVDLTEKEVPSINKIVANDLNSLKAGVNYNEIGIQGAITGYKGVLLIADVPTQDGVYTPTDEGTYTNAGNLQYLPTTTDLGFAVTFIKGGSTWVKNRVTSASNASAIESIIDLNSGKTNSSNLINKNSSSKINGGGTVYNTGGSFAVNSSYDCMPVLIEQNTYYTSQGFNTNGAFLANYCKKVASTGALSDYVPLTGSEMIDLSSSVVTVANNQGYVTFKSPSIVSAITDLYILVNTRWTTMDLSNVIMINEGSVKMNYQDYFILSDILGLEISPGLPTDPIVRALTDENSLKAVKESVSENAYPSVNLVDKNLVISNNGIIYNSFTGVVTSNASYDCVILPLNKGAYYSFSGHTLNSLGTNGSQRAMWAKKVGDNYIALTDAELPNYTTYRTTNKAWIELYSSFNRSPTFTITAPVTTLTEQIYIIVNTRFNTVDCKETLQIELGTIVTPYTPHLVVGDIFGFGFDVNSGSSSVSRYANKMIAFFGDSITAGTSGGYVSYVDEITQSQSSNYGSSGADTGRLAGIMTIIKDRDAASPSSTPDYNLIDALTIMIGTNGGVRGSISDIPAQSYQDIPFTDGVLIDTEEKYLNLFADTFYGNLGICIEYVKQHNPNTYIYLVTPPHSDRGSYAQMPAVRLAMIEIAKFYSIAIIDSQDHAGIEKKQLLKYSADLTHLNALGNELWGKYLGYKILSE